MVDDRLLDYIKKQMQAGYSVSSIETVLKQSGYSEEIIDSAIDKALTPDDNLDMKKSGKSLWIVIAMAVILAIGAGAYFMFFQGSTLVEPDPALIEPIVTGELESVQTEPVVEEPVDEIPEPVIEEVYPDIWIEAPLEDASYENPVVLPSRTFEFNQNETVSITMKVFVTEFVSGLEPNITCNQIPDENIVTYPYEGEAIVGDQAFVTFVLKPVNRVLFAECDIEFPTSDLRVLKRTITITVPQ